MAALIGLALLLIPAGWVLLYTAINGDGSNSVDEHGKPVKTYSLTTAFQNALHGSLHGTDTGATTATTPAPKTVGKQ